MLNLAMIGLGIYLSISNGWGFGLGVLLIICVSDGIKRMARAEALATAAKMAAPTQSSVDRSSRALSQPPPLPRAELRTRTR